MGCSSCCDSPPAHFDHHPEPGITEKRSCHDVIFILLFIGFWVGMGYVGHLALQQGNPERLIYGFDYEGNVCGTDNKFFAKYTNHTRDLRDKPYLYFLPTPNLTGALDVCVSSCPTSTYFPPTAINQLICPYGVTPDLNDKRCYGSFATVEVIHRCIPFLSENITEDIKDELTKALDLQEAINQTLKFMADIIEEWQYILAAAGLALAVSFLWLFFLRLFAGVLVWMTIILVILVIAALAVFVYQAEHNITLVYNELPPYAALIPQEDTVTFLKAVFFILVGIDAIIILAVICMANRIHIAVGLIEEASKAMAKIPLILLVPVGVAIAIIPLAVYWVWIGAYLASAGKPIFDDNGKFVDYKADSTLIYMQLYHLFGGFWTLNFFHAIGECTIAGAIAGWYWVHDKSNMPEMPIATSLRNIFRYHLGSLLFGSLILALIQFIRFLMNQLQRRLKNKATNAANFIFKCVNCCLACFQRFIEFLTTNAYIMIAIYGYSFCEGARRGFTLVASNALRVAALNCVTGFVVFIGKLFVTMVTTFVFFMILSRDTPAAELSDFMAPIVVIAVLSFAISTAFFAVFDMAVDTLLLCFCEDTERNDGSDEKPYFMSDNLKRFVEHDHGCGCCC